jgi:DNA-binding beta-propeller fold protein YncE
MGKLNKILFLASIVVLCSYAYSQETTLQDTAGQKLDTTKQDAAKTEEESLPVKCVEVINIGHYVGAIAVDSKKNIYLATLGGCSVYNSIGEKAFDISMQDRQCPTPWEKDVSPVSGIDIDSKDNIYLCNNAHYSVEKITVAGDFVKKIILPKSPKREWSGVWSVVVDEDGTIYVPAHNRFVYIFDKDSNILRRWAKSGDEKDQFANANAIAIDRYEKSKQKRIYVGDNYAYQVTAFSKKEKKKLFSFGSRGSNPGEMLEINGIDVDSEGRIYVLDGYSGYCSVFSADGKFLFRFGQSGPKEKRFYFSTGIFIDKNDKIYIANGKRNNVLVWEYKKNK